MADWADKIAGGIFDKAPRNDEWFACPSIATALRKAKADGLREAERFMIGIGNSTKDVLTIRAMANKIERGE